MSVAFRRESDEEHKEPRFELPIPPGPNLVTQNGLAAITARLAAIDALIAIATDDEQRLALKREYRYWSTRRSTAQLAPLAKGDEVAFGCRVTFQMAGKTKTIGIVGGDEADPATGRIAFTAPLVVAMLGAAAGEFCDFAGKERAIEVVAVEAMA